MTQAIATDSWSAAAIELAQAWLGVKSVAGMVLEEAQGPTVWPAVAGSPPTAQA